MNLALINPRVWLELALAGLIAFGLWYAYSWAYDRGAAVVQAKWDAETAQVQAQSTKVAQDALTTTKALAATIETQRSNANAQIAAANANAAAAIAGLRDRPSRGDPGSVPSHPADTATAAGCTGAGLYRQDAEFLVGEAVSAKQLRIELKACYAAHDSARAALK